MLTRCLSNFGKLFNLLCLSPAKCYQSSMFIPLFRTSLGQSAQLVTVSRRSVSQFVGTVNRNLIARSSLGSHAIHSRNLTTTFAVNAAPKAAVAVKKKSTKPVKKKRVVAKKRTVKKKAPPPKKKKKTKKPVKLAAPKSMFL